MRGVYLMQDDLSNEVELEKKEENSAQNTDTVKKVKITKTIKRPVRVKAKAKPVVEENKEEKEAVQLELPLENQVEATSEEVEKPKKRGRTPKAAVKKASKKPISKKEKTPKAEKTEEVEKTEISSEVKEEPVVEVVAPVVEKSEAVVPAEISEEKSNVEAENSESVTDTEVNAEENGENKDEGNINKTQSRFNKKVPGQKFNKKDKYNKNNRRPEVEYPPEINAIENPEAPRIFVSELLTHDLDYLRSLAREKGISEEAILECRKQDLIEEILKHHTSNGGVIMVEGTVEVLPDGFGLIRYAINSYLASSEDVYIPQNQIKANGLRTGDQVFGQVRTPREYDRSYVIFKIISINGDTPQTSKLRVPFDSLTPLFPDEKLHLEVINEDGKADLSTRVVDLFCPIGKGQRSLIVAPPRTGKTVIMQKIANAISANHPEVELIVLLVDERPEEVTDMRRHVKAEVVASTFDEQATRHVQVAEMVIEKAKRMVEYHKDVVILLDSITRLARAYNQTVPASGKILSGGVDSNALHRPKRFLGAARNIENGGSLTIISTALIETSSRMDEVIFEEFKGTGNNEIVLDRRMADARKFPAINIKKSGTRRDDLLLSKDEQTRIWLLRNAVSNMDDVDMSVFLIDKMKKNSNNKEFLASISSSSSDGMRMN